MNAITARRIPVTLAFSILAITVLTFSAACNGSNTQHLQGILENIDTISGQITIVTEDRETHVITFDSTTQVTNNGETVAIGALEPGAHIEIELEKGGAETARTIEARLARVEGTVSSWQDGELTVTPENGGQPVRIKLDNTTQIRTEDGDSGTTADLSSGIRVEVRYDPQTDIASGIYLGKEINGDTSGNDDRDNSSETPTGTIEVMGTVTGISDGHIGVNTGTGSLVVSIDNSTVFKENDDSPRTAGDISISTTIKLYYDPDTMTAVKIEIEDEIGGESGEREEQNETEDNETEEGEDSNEDPPAIPHAL